MRSQSGIETLRQNVMPHPTRAIGTIVTCKARADPGEKNLIFPGPLAGRGSQVTEVDRGAARPRARYAVVVVRHGQLGMRDDEQGPGAAEGAVEAELQDFRIERGKALVEDGEFGVLQQRAGEIDAAPFAMR